MSPAPPDSAAGCPDPRSLTKTNGDDSLSRWSRRRGRSSSPRTGWVLGVPFLTRRPSHHSAGWKTPASLCSDSINGAGSALRTLAPTPGRAGAALRGAPRTQHHSGGTNCLQAHVSTSLRWTGFPSDFARDHDHDTSFSMQRARSGSGAWCACHNSSLTSLARMQMRSCLRFADGMVVTPPCGVPWQPLTRVATE